MAKGAVDNRVSLLVGMLGLGMAFVNSARGAGAVIKEPLPTGAGEQSILEERYIGIDEIQPGMQGYGMTVFIVFCLQNKL